MDDLKIVVCMKVTPKPEEVSVDFATNLLDRENARSEINPPDMNALEVALSLKDKHGGTVFILSMGPPLFKDYLPVGLAMGADHFYLLSDRDFSGADTLATTYTLAKGIEHIGGVDLVICGEESSDGATGQVPPGIAEWLDWSQITVVDDIRLDLQGRTVDGRREIAGGSELHRTALPAVISVKTASNEPRFMNYPIDERIGSGAAMTVWTAQDIDADPSMIGLVGSPTVVSGLDQAPSRERRREILAGDMNQITEKLVDLLYEHVK